MPDVVTSILKTFKENLRKGYFARSNRDLSRFEVHAYDAYTLCARKICLAYEKNMRLSPPKYWPDKTLLTFRIGEKLEDILRENLKAKRGPKIQARLGKIWVVGHPDIIFERDGKKYLIECKSIKKEYFDVLSEPYLPHKYQVLYYLYLGRKLGLKYETDQGYVVYIPKQESTDVLKIFPVPWDKDITDFFNSEFKKVRLYFKDGRLPERLCLRADAPLAKECLVKEVCFGLL